MSERSPLRGRASGNREVSRLLVFIVRGDLSGALDEAIPEEESEAELRDERGVFA